jgi:hypothetical protein
MANSLYDIARHDFATAALDWVSITTIKVALVDTGVYTYSAAHQYYSSVSSGVVGTPVALTSRAVGASTGCDADDSTFTAVTGASVEALVIYIDTGTAGTSRLVAYIDTATGLPITPNGGDIIVIWDSGTNRIFRV